MKTQSTKTRINFPALFKQVVDFIEHEDVQASLKKLPGIVQNFRPQAEKSEIVTYNEVVEYFVKSRPDNARVVKGALMIEDEEGQAGKKLTFIFLDAENEPVIHNGKSHYGKTVITKAIDEALIDFSEGRSVIIFE